MKIRTLSIFSALIFTLALSTSACKNSVSGHNHDHHDAEGFRLIHSGTVIVDKLPNQAIVNDFPELKAGETLQNIEVWFYDFETDLFQPDDEDGLSLAVASSASEILEIDVSNSGWSFTIHALAAGNTELTIQLMHGDHADFTSVAIPVTINE